MRDVFVGRTGELALLGQVFEATQNGRGALLVMSGEPGVGKTRLSEHAAAQFEAAGAQVLRGRCWDFGGAPTFMPWSEIVGGAAEGLSTAQLRGALSTEARVRHLAAICTDLAERLGVDGAAVEAGDWVRVERFEAVARLLEHRALAAPQVVLFDDAHGADAPSLQLLLFLARRLSRSAVLMLATARSVGVRCSDEVLGLLAELRQSAQVVPLAGIDEPALREWLSETARFEPDPQWVTRLWARTRGNPLFVRGLLLAALERGEVPALGQAETVLPADVQRTVDARLTSLSLRARALLDVAAVFGRPASLAQLQAVGDGLDVAEAAREAQTAGVLERRLDPDRYDFSHGLFRESLVSSLSAAGRARLHLRVAQLLEASTPVAAPAELARHYRGAGTLAPALAVSWSWRAGEAAMEATDFAEAVQHCQLGREWAARLPVTDAQAWELRLLLGEARARLAQSDQGGAQALYRTAAELCEVRNNASGLADAALGFARTGEYGAADPERQRWLDKAAAVARRLPAPLRAQVLARHAMETWAQAPSERRTGEALTEALALARESGDAETLASVLSNSLQTLGAPEEQAARIALCDELSQAAGALPELEWQLEAHRWRLNVSIELGDMATARREVEGYARVAEASRRPQLLANARLREGFAPSLVGDFDALTRSATETREAQRRAQDPQADLIYVARRVLDCADAGALEGVANVLSELKEQVKRLPHFLMYRAILVRALWLLGRPADARGEWEALHAKTLGDLPRNFTTLATLCLMAEPAVALGDAARAKAIYALLEPHAAAHASIGASRSLGPVAFYAAVLAKMLGLDGAARAHRAAGEALAARMGATFWQQRLRELDGPGSAVPKAAGAARFEYAAAEWLMSFEGRTARLPDGRGLRLLAELLSRPGQSVPVLELAGPTPEGRAGARPEQSESPLLDAQAMRAYRARVARLREALEDAETRGDVDSAEALREELEVIALELKRATGLGGRARMTSGPAERARVAVTKALTRALDAIAKVHPPLAEHFEACVATGSRCSYTPPPSAPVEWVVTP